MKRNAISLVTLLVCAASSVRAQTAPPLRLVQTIPLPDVEGRIDHMAADAKGQRLFVAALGNNTLEVVDLRAGKRTHTIRGLHEPQGIAFVPEMNRIFVANGQGAGCDVYDGGTFQRIATVPLGDDSDNVRYDARAKDIYVGYGSGALAAIRTEDTRRTDDVKLNGHPESFQLARSGPRLFVNVPQAGHIAVVDRSKHAVVARWPLDGARANFPMALDEADHRLIVGCRNPAKLLVYDIGSGRVVASLDINGDTDDLFYDAARKRIYVSCGEGFVDVIRQTDPDHYETIAKIRTAAGARTSYFVPELGRLCLAVPHRGDQQAEIRIYAVAK